MTKILRLNRFGGIENLTLDDVDLKNLDKDEALINVKATGITGDNLSFIKGRVLPGEEGSDSIFPATLGYEATGIVEAVGMNVDNQWVGKRVAPVGPYDFLSYGSIGEKAIVPANRLIEIPEKLSFEEAAGLWVPYLTAAPIQLYGNLEIGDYAVITAGTSTVGNAAIQYVTASGATPIATTRSRKKAEILQTNTGIKDVIITSEENYLSRINEITQGKGSKLVFDSIGGTFIDDLASGMTNGGTIIEYGVLGGLEAPLPVSQILSKGLSIRGFAVNEIVENEELFSKATDYVLSQIENGVFKPKIAATFSLEDYQAAFEQLIKNDKLGRIILIPNK
ncbi:MAG: zinc-dependent alcohol dehydrogenase family protein [Enterococcus sp.]